MIRSNQERPILYVDFDDFIPVGRKFYHKTTDTFGICVPVPTSEFPTSEEQHDWCQNCVFGDFCNMEDAMVNTPQCIHNVREDNQEVYFQEL